ncbi:hypothetical protein F2Q69_00045015 [Brassica cretica]|uniref:Uncharacterized protein n=1 Tax=Brassica cretica TaxID=69181 RepID=A0A8S9NNW3_BRACR|nr:hypothetical protein F2Q69_00045015 [Brassica cretica]
MIRSMSCEDIDPVNEIKLSNIVLGKLKVMKIAMGLGYNLCYVVKFDHITVTLTLTVTGSFFSLAKGRDDRQTHKATYSWSGLVFLLTEAIPVTAKDGSGGHPNEETNRNTEKKKYCFG